MVEELAQTTLPLAKSPVSRRLFLRQGVLGSITTFLAALGASTGFFLWPKNVGAFGGRVLVGRLEDFPVGSITRVRSGKFYISSLPEGLLALYWRCTHLGCTVPWKPEEEFILPSGERLQGIFHCPCHGSIFTRTGQIVAGPAPRPMDIMEIRLEGDKVVVDTGKIRSRPHWEPSQAVPV